MPYQFEPRNLEREIALTLPEQLRFLRKYNAVKQKEVATALRIERSTYAYYETGATQPSLTMVMRMALLYDVTTDFLLGIPQKEKQPTPFEHEILLLVSKHFSNGGENSETRPRV